MFICRLLRNILNFQKMPLREFWANQFLRNGRNQVHSQVLNSIKILFENFNLLLLVFFDGIFLTLYDMVSNFFYFSLTVKKLIVAKNQTPKSTVWLSKCSSLKASIFFAKTCLMTVKENSQNLGTLSLTVLKIPHKKQNNLN